MAKITIFGLAGTGKTTTAKLLSEKLGYTFMSTGNIFRGFAEDLGLSLNEFENLASQSDEYDRKLDERVKKYGEENDNFIFESRLAWHFIPDSIKIKLDCPFEVRTKRITDREDKDLDQVQEETKHREDSIRKRYKDYYGIENFEDDKNFDLVISTEENPPDKVVEIILNFLNSNK